MELHLTPEQEQHLNAHGPFGLNTVEKLKTAFRQSVEDQQQLLDQAAKIRAEQVSDGSK